MEKLALNPRSQELIKNYLIGGAALGGSGALLTSLVNYMNTLKQQGKKPENEEDDDTLYLNVNSPKPAVKPLNKMATSAADWAAPGLALTGGTLATLGSYALVRKAYQSYKKKQLQEELNRSQQAFIDQAQQEGAAAKTAAQAAPAGESMGFGESLTGLPVSFSLLAALAAGALSNAALNKTFPRVKKPQNVGPKRVVIRKNPDEVADPNTPVKTASDKLTEQNDYDDGIEFLTHIVMGTKSAHDSDLVNIVHAVSQGRHDEFTNMMLEYGFDTAVTTIKGASEIPMNDVQKQLSISLCVKSAVLNPVISLLAAAEYNEMAPRLTSTAALQSEEDLHMLYKFAAMAGAEARHDTFDKHPLEIAAEQEGKQPQHGQVHNLDEILKALNKIHAEHQGHPDLSANGDDNGEPHDVEQTDALNTEDSIESGEEKHVNDTRPMADGKRSPDIVDEMGDEDDFIDKAMSHTIVPAKAVAAQKDHAMHV